MKGEDKISNFINLKYILIPDILILFPLYSEMSVWLKPLITFYEAILVFKEGKQHSEKEPRYQAPVLSGCILKSHVLRRYLPLIKCFRGITAGS